MAESKPKKDITTQAEQSVLGAILLNNRHIQDVQDIIAAGDFTDNRNQIIYESMIRLWMDSKPVDVLTVQAELSKRDNLSRAGGMLYLDLLFDQCPASENASHYARIVKSSAEKRDYIKALEISRQEINQDITVPEAIAKTTTRLNGLLGVDVSTCEYPIAEAMRLHSQRTTELFEKHLLGEKTFQGIQTGIPQLDTILGGLGYGTTNIIAARTGVGKSVAALNIALNVALQRMSVLYFSPEMTAHALNSRLLARLTNINSRDINRGTLSREQYAVYQDKQKFLSGLRLTINDRAGISIDEIRQVVQKWDHKFGHIDLIIVDYLGLVTCRDYKEDTPLLGHVSVSLKNLAKDYKSVVLALHQVNREGSGGKPKLKNLYGADKIAFDADTVTMLWVEDEELEIESNFATMSVSVVKNREGLCGMFSLPFHKHISFLGKIDEKPEPAVRQYDDKDDLDDNFL